MALVLNWKKKLGYKKDPFEQTIPRPAQNYIVGFEKQQEQFNLFLIKNDKYSTLTGPPGTGKSMFLSWAYDVLKRSQYRIDTLDAKQARGQVKIIDTLLSENTGLFTRKMTLKKPAEEKYKLLLEKLHKKQHILLIDNGASLAQEGLTLLFDVMEKTHTHIVFADETLPALTSAKLKLTTPNYTEEDLRELLQHRIEAAGSSGTFPFDDKECSKLFKKSGGNPAKLLDLARERAIELSLKEMELPQEENVPKPKTKKKKASKAPMKRLGFLNIKIDHGEEDEAPPPIEDVEPVASESHVEPEEKYELPEAEMRDAEELSKILETSTIDEVEVENEEKPKKKRSTGIDKDIKKLAEEFEKPKKKKKK